MQSPGGILNPCMAAVPLSRKPHRVLFSSRSREPKREERLTGHGMLRRFSSDGVHIAYIDVPPESHDRGEPILLIHGFASNHRINWVNPRWVETLNRAGRRVIAFDNRGHGDSEKLYAPADYRSDLMARDAANLLAHARRRARRRHGLFDGRAHRQFPRAARPRARARRSFSAASATGWWTAPGFRKGSPKRWRRRRSKPLGPDAAHVPRFR